MLLGEEETYIPQMDTRMVAMWRDRTNGASDMAPAKIKWLIIHAVKRSGLYLSKLATIGAMWRGGRGVKFRRRYSGERTKKGRIMEAAKVTMENMTREKEPMRPISPRASSDFFVEAASE